MNEDLKKLGAEVSAELVGLVGKDADLNPEFLRGNVHALTWMSNRISAMTRDNLIRFMHDANAARANQDTTATTKPAPATQNTPPEFEALSFGSDPNNRVVLPGLAKFHAVVRFYSDGHVTVHDYGTASGTFIEHTHTNRSTRVQGSAPFFGSYDLLKFVTSPGILGVHRFTYESMISQLLQALGRDALFPPK